MTSEWADYSIEELASDRPGSLAVGPFGSRMKADLYVQSGVRIIRGQNLADSPRLIGDFVHVTEATAASLPSCRLMAGDLVFPHRGNIGEVGITPADEANYMLSTSLMKLGVNRKLVLPEFLYYFFRSAAGRAALLMNASQVGTPGIATPLRSLRSIRVEVPPLKEQDRIVGVLSALDDRIALLRETIATLEAIAQALFKSWFVDFDPVRAKRAGCAPEGMDAATAVLFPDTFEDSELGEVPRGWRVQSLDGIATYLNGLALQKFPPESDDEYLPVVKIAQLRAGNTHGADRASARLKPDYVVRDGDVLFSWSGSLEVEFWCGGDGALNQHLFKVTSGVVAKWFYYLATRHFLPGFREIAAHKATTMGHIQRKHLTEARLAVPPAELMETLGMVLGPILDRRIQCALHARKLTALRDTLLPRLISGQLRLPEAEESIEDALA